MYTDLRQMCFNIIVSKSGYNLHIEGYYNVFQVTHEVFIIGWDLVGDGWVTSGWVMAHFWI